MGLLLDVVYKLPFTIAVVCRGQHWQCAEHHGSAIQLHYLPGHVQHDVCHAHPGLRALCHVQVTSFCA